MGSVVMPKWPPKRPPAVFRDREQRQAAALVALLTALLVMIGAQVARAMFPLLFYLGEDRDFFVVGLVALAVYATPVLAAGIPNRGPQALLGGGLAMVAAYAAVAVADPVPAQLAMPATAVMLVGATLVFGALARLFPLCGVEMFAGLLLGLAADNALRAPAFGFDLIWRGGALPTAAIVVIVFATVAVILTTVRRATRAGGAVAGLPLARRIWPVGPYLALQLLFLQNAAYLASQADASPAVATTVVLAGDALALATALFLTLRRPPGPPAVAVGSIVAGLLASRLGQGDGWPVVATVVMLQVFTTVGVALATSQSRPMEAGARHRLGGAAVGMGFFVVALLWQIDIDRPLPFARTAIPLAATLLVGWGALRAAGRLPQLPPLPDALRWPTVPSIVGALACLAIVVPAAVRITEPKAGAATASQVRLVSYNVRGALDVDGQLRPEVVAREIASSNPDVVVLQEVARGWPIFGAADLLADLADRLGMAYRWEPAADSQFGNAILSRLPITSMSGGRLPAVSGKQVRSWLAVTVDVAGRPLTLVGAHLESHSIAQIDALLSAWGGRTPAVVAGDFNIKPRDQEPGHFIRGGLVDAMAATGDGCRTTSADPTSDCDRPDWLFVTPDVPVSELRIGTGGASDHLPIHATITVPAQS